MKFRFIGSILLLLGLSALGSPKSWAQSFFVSDPELVVTDEGRAWLTFTTTAPSTASVSYQSAGAMSIVVAEADAEPAFSHAIALNVTEGLSYSGTITATSADNSTASLVFGPLTVGAPETDIEFQVAPQVFVVGPSTAGGPSQAVIAFTTDRPSLAHVDYGPSGASPTLSAGDEEFAVTHALLLSGLQDGQTYTFLVSATGEDGSVATIAPMQFTATSLERDYGPGDVNGDAQVTVADAVLALNYVVGRRPLSEIQIRAGDINNDGRISISDVILLLQWAMGLAPGMAA